MSNPLNLHAPNPCALTQRVTIFDEAGGACVPNVDTLLEQPTVAELRQD